VLEANGKVKPLDQFGCRFKYITTSRQGVDVQNLIKIDSAVAALRMREKNAVSRVFFCIHIYLSIYPLFDTPAGHIFSAILTLNGSYDVFLQPLVPFGSCDEIAPHLGDQIPKPPFWGRVNRRFQPKLVKSKNMHIIQTIASIPTKFCTAIKTTKRPSRVVPTHT